MYGYSAATLQLVDGDETITIRSANPNLTTDPVICSKWDLGAPDVRDATADRQSADGTDDATAYIGARTVALDLSVMGLDPTRAGVDALRYTPYYWVDRLAAMAHPSRRPILRITRISPETGYDKLGMPEHWDLLLRGNPFSVSYDRAAAGRLQMQLTFTAPLGYLEGPWRGLSSNEVVANAAPGITLPITFPWSTGAGYNLTPTLSFRLTGSVPVSPVLYFYGPAKNPWIRTDDNERFGFKNLTLQAGQFIQVDMEQGTAYMGGSADASMYRFIDFDTSTFWRWLPNRVHTVRYHAASGYFKVQYRERRLTI